MKSILVTHPSHFVRGPDGRVYAPDTFLGTAFWARYLAGFDCVGVVARVRPVEAIPPETALADSEHIRFHDLPDYVGPRQYLRCRRTLKASVEQAINDYDAYCVRAPCPIANLTWRALRRRGLAFGVEVTGDPWDSLGPGTVRSAVRPIFRRMLVRRMRVQCREASAVAYVTRETLQVRYPPNPGAYTTNYSSIELSADALIQSPREDFEAAHRLIFVGSLAVRYKGVDVLIDALAKLNRSSLTLDIVGDGRSRPELESQVEQLGLAGQITFHGRLPAGDPIRALLDQAHLFILPSRAEGLPRALIEAMARGLPCIGSDIGAIGELLALEDRVPPGDAAQLAQKIQDVLASAERLRSAGQRNRERSRDYLADVLEVRRTRFYQQLSQLSVSNKEDDTA